MWELNVGRAVRWTCVGRAPEGALWACPTCAQELPLYDHAEERTWRHLTAASTQTRLHARIPLVHCGEHGVVQVRVPWAEPRSRFTLLFERLAIDVVGQCDGTGATKILRISWDEASGIMERAVKRGRSRKTPKVVRRIGVDEKAVAKWPSLPRRWSATGRKGRWSTSSKSASRRAWKAIIGVYPRSS